MSIKKMRVDIPILVEGKYDKNTLLQILDATVIVANGFGIFNSNEKKQMILRLAERGGIILFTDSDGGGIQIRKYLLGILPKDKVINLYIPQIKGKEKRKQKASSAGFLGVEGMDRETIERLFAPFAKEGGVSQKNAKFDDKMITKVDFFEDGLSGGDNSSEKRDRLAERLRLPRGMSAKALIEALNILSSYEEYKAALADIEAETGI